MPAELCPKCREVRQLETTTTVVNEERPDGSHQTVRTEAFHCSICHSFVRSEVHEEQRPAADDD